MLKRVLTDHWDGWNRSTSFFVFTTGGMFTSRSLHQGQLLEEEEERLGGRQKGEFLLLLMEASFQLQAAAAVQFQLQEPHWTRRHGKNWFLQLVHMDQIV